MIKKQEIPTCFYNIHCNQLILKLIILIESSKVIFGDKNQWKVKLKTFFCTNIKSTEHASTI